MTTATLTYEHWKHGQVRVQVQTTGYPSCVAGRATLYQLGNSGDVWNAGRIIDGEARYSNPVRIGWNGRLEYAYNDAAQDAELERHRPIQERDLPGQREEEYGVCQNRLIRKVQPRRGKGYEHHCPIDTFREVCMTIDEWDGAFVYEDIQAATDRPHSQVATAIAFLKERGTIVPVPGRRHQAATEDTLIDGMVEWCYLEQSE